MRTALHLIIIAAIFAITAFYCLSLFGGFEPIGDGNDYAGLARSLVNGQGFSLGHIYPLGFAFSSNIPQPDNMWSPGYPLYLAVMFSIFGVGDKACLIGAILAVWILVMAAYFIGREIGGAWLALLAAGLTGLNQIVLYAALEGTPEILAASFLTFAILLLIQERAGWRLFLSGLLFGAAILIRYQAGFLIFPAIVFFYEKPRRIPLWIGGIAITLAPWLIRNWLVLGNPFFTLQSYGEFTKGMGRFEDYYSTYRSFTPMSLSYVLLRFPLDLIKKFIGGLLFFAGAFPLRLNFLGIIPFFFVLLRLGALEDIRRKIVIFTFLSTAMIVILSSLDGHHDRHLVTIQPLLVITMLIGFDAMARDLGFAGIKWIMIPATALLFLPCRAPFQEMRLSSMAAHYRDNQLDYREIAQFVEPDKAIISDASDALWWYANRPSVWIPAHYADFKTLVKSHDIRYLYLADPVAYMEKLSEDDVIDFVFSVEIVPEYSGTGKLYIIKNIELPVNNLII